MRKTLLFILQRAPYGSSAVRETLDAAFAAAAFEQDVQLLFTGEGVWQLLPGQKPATILCKDTGKVLQALDYYDISSVYVDSLSLAERQLSIGELAIPATPASSDMLQELLRAADCVISL